MICPLPPTSRPPPFIPQPSPVVGKVGTGEESVEHVDGQDSATDPGSSVALRHVLRTDLGLGF